MKLKSIIGLLFLPALVFTVQAAEFPLCLNGDGCGFLNADGTWRKTTAFDEVGEFSSDGLAPVRQGNKWGFINLQGQIVITPLYDRVWEHDSNDLAMIELRW